MVENDGSLVDGFVIAGSLNGNKVEYKMCNGVYYFLQMVSYS